MKILENQTYGQERSLYGQSDLQLINCAFDGPEDGESALKECRRIRLDGAFCNLRYPFWHDQDLEIRNSEMTELCRAALWYCDNVRIRGTKLHGIKALRECSQVRMQDCDIRSAEFGWSVRGLDMEGGTAQSEYFLLRGEEIHLSQVHFTGKYSFQYTKNVTLEDCTLDTKDAFWHAKNVTVKNCTVKGEYLAWYSDGLTFVNCKIIGTQPFCYCRNLKLIDCQMVDTDLCFEKSQVEATITTPVVSIKNPLSGKIRVPEVGQIIRDDENAKGEIFLGASQEGV